MQSMDNAYDALDIPPTTDFVTIQKAFRRKALQCHPDKARVRLNEDGKNDWSYVTATEQFQNILRAFECLKAKFCQPDKEVRLIENCRRCTALGEANSVPLSALQKLDSDLFCLQCRCGYDIPVEIDFLSQYEVL